MGLLLTIFIGIVLLFLSIPLIWYYTCKLPPSPPANFFEDLLIGHRGSNLSKLPEPPKIIFPENSLSAMRYAISQGVDGVEFDTTLTKDGEAVVTHDSTTTRMFAENPKISSSVVECTLEELKTLRYKNSPEEERIPTLKEVLEMIKNPSTRSKKKIKLMIEVKQCSDHKKMAEIISSYFEEYDLYETAVVGSFFPMILYRVRQRNPKIVTLFLVRDGLFSIEMGMVTFVSRFVDHFLYWCSVTWLPSFLGVGVIGFHNVLIPQKGFNVVEWKKRGYVLNCWTVNEPKEKDFLRSHGVSVTTDHLF